jgi:TPR repeat protein
MANACSDLGLMYYSADGVSSDRARGLEYLKRACDLGSTRACGWLKNPGS